MKGPYSQRVKTLATFECLGETFRVCWHRRIRADGRVVLGRTPVIVHGEHWMYTAQSPYHVYTVEQAIEKFTRGARNYEIQYGTKASERMLADIAKMKGQ